MDHSGLMFVLLFWGVWLLIPLVTDGLSTLWHLLVSLWTFRRRGPPPVSPENLPLVSVVIPAYNEEFNIDRCILSLKAQTYPHHLLEIIVVNDGSQDHTSDSVLQHMGNLHRGQSYLRTNSFIAAPQEFGGVINLVRRKRGSGLEHGKPAAVNSALRLISGELVVAIDSDVVLEPDAIDYAVRAFMADENLVAATGHLIIDPYLAVATNRDGSCKTDARGLPLARRLNASQRFLTACQFIEYATAFHLGRHSEGAVDSMFTLSGACAVYRRKVFDIFGGYRGRTVSEDTDMTLTLHEMQGAHIGYLSGMRVHLEPVLSWATLYAQRVRWQRGALEVSAVHTMAASHHTGKRFFWRFALPLRLQVDHTLALPRLAWTLMIFMMPLFGYSWNVISLAMSLLMVFYVVVNLVRVMGAYFFSQPPEKVLIRRYLRYIPLLPLYNMFLFWVRMSALMRTLTEEATWTVSNSLLVNLENGSLQRAALRAAASFMSTFS